MKLYFLTLLLIKSYVLSQNCESEIPQIGTCESDSIPSNYPDQTECSKYWLCVSGCALQMECQDNFLFDIKEGYCNYPDLVDCAKRPCKDPDHCDGRYIVMETSTSATTEDTEEQEPNADTTPVISTPSQTTTTTTTTTPTTASTNAPTAAPTTAPTIAPTATPTTEFDYDCAYYCENLAFGNFVRRGECLPKFCECPSSSPLDCDVLHPNEGRLFCSETKGCVYEDECNNLQECKFLETTTTITTTETPPAQPCYDENAACKFESENLLLDPFTNIQSISVCEDLCKRDNCDFYTYYSNKTETPLSLQCHLFKSCETLISIPGATTGTLSGSRDCLCSLDLVSEDAEVLRSTAAATEYLCSVECQAELECSHYMYKEDLGMTGDCNRISKSPRIQFKSIVHNQ